MVRFLRVLSIGLGILGSAVCASSQDVGSLLANARKLMSEYSYEEASSFYEQAESMVSEARRSLPVANAGQLASTHPSWTAEGGLHPSLQRTGRVERGGQVS